MVIFNFEMHFNLGKYFFVSIENIVEKEIGKKTANMDMMRSYCTVCISSSIMQSSDAWLTSLIPRRGVTAIPGSSLGVIRSIETSLYPHRENN